MKNKLLTTTAIASLLMASGYASAQTTVTGNLNLNYRANSSKGDGGLASMRSIGKETQINIQNKGKTNIAGLEYAAGFSLEHDGNERSTTSQHLAGMFNENVYLDFIMGNTTLTFGADHIQNPDAEITSIAAMYNADHVSTSIRGTPIAVSHANSNYTSYGVGVMQTFPGIGRLSFNYTPVTNGGSANADTGTSTLDQIIGFDRGESAVGSAYEVGFIGDFGVKGLQARIFRAKVQAPNNFASSNNLFGRDLDGYKYGLSYTVGNITAAVSKSHQEAMQTTLATNTFDEFDTKSFGIGYAVSKDVSLGYNLTKTERNRITGSAATSTKSAEEKLQMLSLSYSLGPIATALQVARADNLGGTAGVDQDSVLLSFTTRF